MGNKTSQILASQVTVNWKNGVPGNPYIAGDTVIAQHGSIVMVQVLNPDLVQIQLPAITPESAGRRVEVRKLGDPKVDSYGVVAWFPDPADQIEALSTGAAAQNAEFQNSHDAFESTGTGRWNFVASHDSLWAAPYP